MLIAKELHMIRIKRVLPLMLLVALGGCAPYALAVQETYNVATDPRSLATQATDTEAEVQIKAALVASPVRGTSGIDAYCRQGVVVLVSVVPPGSQAGQAVRQTPGVRRVETYFVPSRPSWQSDITMKEPIRATLIADPALVSGRVDIAVFAGHVVLVEVVDSRANVQKFISDASSVPGVVSVTSYIRRSKGDPNPTKMFRLNFTSGSRLSRRALKPGNGSRPNEARPGADRLP
jgi:osmotically-inducible protein OsmY